MRALFLMGLVGCTTSGVTDAPDAPFSMRRAAWFWDPDGPSLVATPDHGCGEFQHPWRITEGDLLLFDLAADGDGYALESVTAVSDGYGFELDRATLTLDAGSDPVTGSFETRYWWGSFEVEPCATGDRHLNDDVVRPSDTDERPPDTDESSGASFVGEWADPGVREGPLLITSFSVGCTPDVGEDGLWTYRATTSGWTTDGLVFVDQDTSNPWSEEHDLFSVDYCEDGSCDLLERVLEGVFAYRDQVVNQTTLFDCDAPTIGTMMGMLSVYDLDGNLADCVVWGADTSIYAQYGCADANGW